MSKLTNRNVQKLGILPENELNDDQLDKFYCATISVTIS